MRPASQPMRARDDTLVGMLRLALAVALVAIVPAAARAQPAAAPAPPRSPRVLDLTVGLGGMADAPTGVAGMLTLGARGAWWIPGSHVGLELALDGATLTMPDPDGFDTTYWSGTSAWRLRAMVGVRASTDPARAATYVFRAAAGIERISLSTTERGIDGPDTRESGADLAPMVELSAGYLARNQYGLELAISRAIHDGASVSFHRLSYDAIALELRFVLAASL